MGSQAEQAALPWEWLSDYTKSAQVEGRDAGEWAARVSLALPTELPYSPELARMLAEMLCSEDGVSGGPLAWKYAERALAARLASPILLLSLLSSRVIAYRFIRPTAYRLYMELLKLHGFDLGPQMKAPNFNKIAKLVDDALCLTKKFGCQSQEPGVLVVKFVLCALWQLLDSALGDEGLIDLTFEKKTWWPTKPQDLKAPVGKFTKLGTEQNMMLRDTNSTVCIATLGHFFQHKVISCILSLARENMPTHWDAFASRLHLLQTHLSAKYSLAISPEIVNKLQVDNKNKPGYCKSFQQKKWRSVVAAASQTYPSGSRIGDTQSSEWIPVDLYLEDCIDGSVVATNSIEMLSGLIKGLQAVNSSTWSDAFLAVWIASLRLVQREREPIEGPVPRLDTRLSMLLSITTLAIAQIIEEEESTDLEGSIINKQLKGKDKLGNCRKELILSLQTLGDYENLLVPPPYVVSAANEAAVKALMFVSGMKVDSGHLNSTILHDKVANCSGNMRHLIVESCISQKLLDTSAYFWPGYTSGKLNQILDNTPRQHSDWSSLMKGATLTQPLVNNLIATPASSLVELEKIFHIAVGGSDDEKVAAATILCGATLIRGWNMQEHTVQLVVKLLSPPVPDDHSGADSHLIKHGPVFNAILTGVSPVDCVQIFSFHGLIPELAASLMEICEVFGCCYPNVSWITNAGEEITAHAVFSTAFILLMRLWKFNHPPLEYSIMGEAAPVGSQLTPEYLLLLRNASVLSGGNSRKRKNSRRHLSPISSPSASSPIFMDSFPKLKLWYRQHQACLASTLSGLPHGTPVRTNVDSLLNMMFKKINNGSSQSSGSGVSGSSGLTSSTGQGNDESNSWPMIPAWEILEAVPFVVDAALTACSHGILSPRELATGLKDLADFLPASLGTIVSYFSAEVTRGVWKPASMNGTDWPSPAANLSFVEEQLKRIVAATGVDVPSLSAGGSSQATLPLPLAAFVSLTITYKLDKASEPFLDLAGPALENLAASCPWPSMSIVAALWTQKVKRWSDFLVFSASRTVFHHNNDAVVQLLRSCFTATLGISSTSACGSGGVGSLLGHGFGSHRSGGLSPVAPGVLYLRVFRCIKDCSLIAEEILGLLMLSVKNIARTAVSKTPPDQVKNTKGIRHGEASLAAAMAQAKVAASLGASLVWLSGGSGLVQSMIQEMLPSWFLAAHDLDGEGRGSGVVHTLGGYTLAYFAMYSGVFAWGIGSTPVSKRRKRVMQSHLEFIAGALDGKIALGCSWSLWRAYVSGFLGLVVECAAYCLTEVDLEALKRLCRGLQQWGEADLALALLRRAGPKAMGAAAELILISTTC